MSTDVNESTFFNCGEHIHYGFNAAIGLTKSSLASYLFKDDPVEGTVYHLIDQDKHIGGVKVLIEDADFGDMKSVIVSTATIDKKLNNAELDYRIDVKEENLGGTISVAAFTIGVFICELYKRLSETKVVDLGIGKSKQYYLVVGNSNREAINRIIDKCGHTLKREYIDGILNEDAIYEVTALVNGELTFLARPGVRWYV